MGFISPAALQQVAGERNIAAVYYQVDIPIIRNQTISQPVVKITKRFRRRVLAALRASLPADLDVDDVQLV
jgi:hypothetical protein